MKSLCTPLPKVSRVGKVVLLHRPSLWVRKWPIAVSAGTSFASLSHTGELGPNSESTEASISRVVIPPATTVLLVAPPQPGLIDPPEGQHAASLGAHMAEQRIRRYAGMELRSENGFAMHAAPNT